MKKYQVELRRSFSQWGRTTIEAENEGHAHAIACRLQADDIAEWKTPDEVLDIVSVAASERPNSDEGGESPRFTSDHLPTEVRQALQAVLDYLYDDEATDFSTLTSLERTGHIFESVLTLTRWLHAPMRQR